MVTNQEKAKIPYVQRYGFIVTVRKRTTQNCINRKCPPPDVVEDLSIMGYFSLLLRKTMLQNISKSLVLAFLRDERKDKC